MIKKLSVKAMTVGLKEKLVWFSENKSNFSEDANSWKRIIL